MDSESYCKHPFDVLLKDESGYWNCMCGATGRLVADYDRKLKFSIPKDKPTRQQRRAWERTVIKEFKKSQQKRQAKTTT